MTAETLNFPVISSEGGLFGGGASANKIASYSAAKDFDLTQAAAVGDMGAFEEIYQRHHRRVYSICLRMLQNAHDAEELTQDDFL